MKIQAVEDAISEAQRFIKAAEKCLAECGNGTYIWGSKHSGATKRASMDLTRALADMRRRPD